MKNPELKPRSRPGAKRIGSTGSQFVLSDELWALMEPLLPPHPNTHRFGGGRPRVPDRTCTDGIFFVLRTGCQWNALSATGLCPSSTAHDRFQAWVEDGFFLRFWQAGLAEYDAFNGIDWGWLAIDGVMTKAPLAGKKADTAPWTAAKVAPSARSWWRLVACLSACAWPGRTKTTSKLLAETLWSILVERPVPSLETSQHLCLDKGYNYEQVRWIAEAFGLTAHIRSRCVETAEKQAGQKARRWPVECTHAWMNRFRNLLTRSTKQPPHALDQEGRQLRRAAPLRLRPHRPPGHPGYSARQ